MIDHALRFVARVVFHVGAVHHGELALRYNPGEPVVTNVVYEITAEEWRSNRALHHPG